jgi:diguanylate cyclase (GGDEF)-like protein
MSSEVAKRKRSQFYLNVAGMLVMVAAVTAIAARDPSGVSFRIGMVLMTIGAASLLPKRTNALMATVVIWLLPNLARSALQNVDMFNPNMLLELPPLLGLAFFTDLSRRSLENLEAENLAMGGGETVADEADPITGVYDERLLRPALEVELARATRFKREFSIVLAGIDSMRQRFDYRDDEAWEQSFIATAKMLLGTRKNIDRVYRYGVSSFAMLLPESGSKDVNGLLRRLSRAARRASPAEGEPGGPLPCHYGATFFPQCATTVDDLLRRAEIVLRIAEKNTTRVQLDGAEAPEMEPPETLREQQGEPELEPANVVPMQQVDPAAMARLAQMGSDSTALPPQPAMPQPSRYADLEQATGTPAIVHLASEDNPGYVPEPVASVPATPAPLFAADPEMEDALSKLLKRMDETSEMMRDLRKSA